MYDVFLSHNSNDKDSVEELARRLRDEAGLRPYLDKWHLRPGAPWQPELEKALEESATAAVFFGPSGLGPWHHEEVRAALARAVQQHDDYRIIPVLLPGARREDVKGFLAQRMWVDFSSGLEDAQAFRRLVAGIQGQAPEVDSFRLPDEPAPYRGLLAFDEAHARFFFGRQAEVDAVLAKLGQHPFVAVVGSSGVGKSSLVLGGVLPALKKAGEEGRCWVLRPGTRPLRALADQVATLLPTEGRLREADSLEARFAERDDGLRTALDTLCADGAGGCLLVVDQLEELFTLAPEETGPRQVEAFLRNLKDAVERGRGRLRVVATLRADFFGRCLQSPALRALLQDRQVLLGSMGPEALRDVIVRPAQAVGAFLERGVVSAILRDVADQPGALPLLAYALHELWRAREGAWLKLATYEASGGVARALEKRAQEALESLPAREQEVARRIFLRLTTLGEGTEDTRRRVARAELRFGDSSAQEVEAVLQRLSGAEARLLVAEEETVEVAHEVLIRQWPTFRGWLEEDRRTLRIHRRLTEAANEWAAHGKDASYLYSGARLMEAEEAFPETSALLNAREREFLAASLRVRAAALQQEEERHRQALVQAQRLAEESAARAEAEKAHAEAERQKALAASRANRRLRVLAGGLLFAAVLLAFYWRQSHLARAVSLSRELTANAIRVLREDPQLSLLLIQEAQASAPTEDVPHALLEWTHNRGLAVLRGHTSSLASASFSPDGTRVVTGGADGTAHVWDPLTGRSLAVFSDEAMLALVAGFSPDGTRVVTASEDRKVRVWDAAAGKLLVTLSGDAGSEPSVLISPDHSRVVTLHADMTAQLWDVATGKRLATLSGHSKAVLAACFSADGTRVVTASKDTTARVWDAATGQLLATLSGHSKAVLDASFSPDGTWVVTASQDTTARVWEVATGRLLATLSGHSKEVSGVDFSASGARVVTVSRDDTARVWEVATGKLLASLSGHGGGLRAALLSPDGTRAVSASRDGTLRLWEVATDSVRATLSGHGQDGWAVVSFSPDGTRVVTGGADATARVWDAATGRSLAILSGHTRAVVAASFSPDGTRLVTASDDGTARVWDAAAGRSLLSLSGQVHPVFAAGFTRDGAPLTVSGPDMAARVWEASTGKPLSTLSGYTPPVRAASFSPDGTRVATSHMDTTVRVWEVATGKPLATLWGGVWAVSFSPDGTRLVTAGTDGTAWVYDVASGKAVATLSGHGQGVWSAGFSPDGTRVVTGSSDHTARVWDVATGKALATLSGHTSAVWTAAFNPEGTRVLTASSDGTARLWDAATGAVLATLSGHTGAVGAAAFSPDGTRVVTASGDRTARVWEAASGKPLAVLSGHHEGVESASFSPDGLHVVTASKDRTARVWEVGSGRQLVVLSGHASGVLAASFSPDGARVVTSSLDGLVGVWHQVLWMPGRVPELNAGRELTCEERREFLHEPLDCPPVQAPPAPAAEVATDSP